MFTITTLKPLNVAILKAKEGSYMKKVKIMLMCIVGTLLLLTGCSGNQSSSQSSVNSGSMDKSYVGDANAQIEEHYKQSSKEKKIQEKVLKKIKEENSSAIAN